MSETSAHNRQQVTVDEIITTVMMARVTDYFGFFVYAIASVLVFPKLFFPQFEPVTAMMLSFAVFSLAFLVRPFASFAARSVQHRIGRTGKITLALMILALSTVAIGLLPGYDKIGALAPVLLVILRIGQGIGLGGSWDGLTLRLKLAAPADKEGTYAMIPQLGGPLGFIVAVSLYYVLHGFLTPEEFIQWGWRFAFFAVIAVSVVSLFARIRMMNSSFEVDEVDLPSAPFGDLLQTQMRAILLSTFLPLASYALFHIVTVFPIAYISLYSDYSISQLLLWQMLGGGLAVLTVIVSGLLSDRHHRRVVIGVSTALMLVICASIGALDSAKPGGFILFGFIVLGLSYGQASAIVTNRFPPEYRYSGAALATNLSWIVGAAFAPLVGVALAATLGLWAVSLYLLSGIVITFYALRELNKGD